MPIAARSALNNGRLKEAKVSSCTRDIDKTVNGKAKRDDKTNVDKRANDNKRRGIDKATIGEVKKGNNKDKNIGRREDKSGNVRGNGRRERVDGEVQPDQHPYPYSLFHSYLHSYSYYHYNLLHYFHIYLLSQALYENFLD